MRPGSPDALARVRETARRLVAEHHLPGLGVAVVGAEGVRLLTTVGLADIESGRELLPEHRHRIGSITKTMVGLCALSLCERGKLSLEARVTELLPEIRFRGPGDALRLHHLLSHTGGIGEAPTDADLKHPERVLWADSVDQLQAVADQYRGGIKLESAPGTKWAYANHGWVLVGEVVARAEGRPIHEVLAQRVFEPLGMRDSDLLDRPHPALTTGYHRPPDQDASELMGRAGIEPPEESPVDGHNLRGRFQWVRGAAAGAAQCTLPDLARYAQALLRRGEAIVSEATFSSMLEPRFALHPRLTSIGLAFFREPHFGRRAFGHNGGVVGGWNTALKVFPDDGIAVVVQQNLSYDGFASVEGALLQAALGAPAPARPELPLAVELLEGAAGLYEATPGRLTNVRVASSTGRVTLEARGSELWLRARRGPWKRGARMRACDPADPCVLELETDDLERPLVVLRREGDRVTELRFDRLVRMVRADEAA